MTDTGPKRYPAEAYVKGILSGDEIMLSRAITLIESTLESDQLLAEAVLQACMPHTGTSYRIGITGAPGVGKSTFIDRFGMMLIRQGLSLAVLAVDPTSILSQGSILGDKTRMTELARNEVAFIRPSPTGGTLGGVANRTREAILLCEAAGYDLILIETVGVGQSEVVVREMVDHFLLLLLPHAGDDLQGMKRGIMEMADTILIHKADGKMKEAAKLASAQFQQVLKFSSNNRDRWEIRVMPGSSLTGEGLENLWQHLKSFEQIMKDNGAWEKQRQRQMVNWFEQSLTEAFMLLFDKDDKLKKLRRDYQKSIASRSMSPRRGARELIEKWRK